MKRSASTIVVKIKKQKIGKGSRKIGRNRVKCALYQALGKRERNKARKIAKDLKFTLGKAEKKKER